ncbi:hypothetical protein J6590_063539 [Homalodisca vitripennis]|nr:hypothetical protein J6590_063539 [Homalodisca vitripennis]
MKRALKANVTSLSGMMDRKDDIKVVFQFSSTLFVGAVQISGAAVIKDASGIWSVSEVVIAVGHA